MAYRKRYSVGTRVTIAIGSDIHSRKDGVIVPRVTVRTDHWNPRHWYAIRLDDGEFITMPRNRLIVHGVVLIN